MYKLETLNNSNFDFIENFNIATEYKEELLDICTNKNIFKKLLLGKNIKFIKYCDSYIGFMWYSKTQHQCYKIHCIRLLPEFNCEYYYNEIFKNFSPNTSVYICDNNNLDKLLLKNIGFNTVKTIVEMKRSMDNINELTPISHHITFRVFVNGLDEKKRCDIQNKVFNSINRYAIDEDDIEYEKYQKHYMPEGCIFISKDSVDIGYGQLIKRDNKIYIANFGILPTYRGHGYGKQLLTYILNIAEGFNEKYIYLRCDEENTDALKLYSSHGFEIIDCYSEYERSIASNLKKLL